MNSFLLRLSGKMQIGEEQAKKKAEELAVKQAEHNRKKKAAQQARKKKKEAEQPEIIVMSGNVKTGAVDITEEEAPKNTESTDTDS